ncbi:MAG TPA: S-adenosylmethionine:tRNA ribosyltransferase-isomerase [bacterium]|nr:S-adenosylmethionine:tRNA ribosyltransferase-isomerase [bacterium]
MDLSLFDYEFPKELTAQHPLPNREDSRMMVVDRTKGSWTHENFRDFPSHLKAGDVLVLNNALADLVEMDGKLVPALPPYIKRKKADDFTEEDFRRYRTVYGQAPGSKAAPTAGFHFSEGTLERLKAMGVEIRFVTLHVSFDTYKPIRSENILEHPMHGERFEVPEETFEAVNRAKAEGRRVIAVGTTSVRALESRANTRFAPTPETKLFITPGYKFQIVDALLTNFHRPKSTVLVMVSAFAGRELVLAAYAEAIRERYRLFSYGDCMLIL